MSIASRPQNNTTNPTPTSFISAFTINQPTTLAPTHTPATLSSTNFPATATTMPLPMIPQAGGMQSQNNYPPDNMMYTNTNITNNPSLPPQNYQYPPNMPPQFSNTTPLFTNNMPSFNYKNPGTIQMNNEMIPNTTTTTTTNNSNNNNNNSHHHHLINGPTLVPGQQNVQTNNQDTNPFDIF